MTVYTKITKERAESVEAGEKLNFGNGRIMTVVGFGETKYKIMRLGEKKARPEKLVILENEKSKTQTELVVAALLGATEETMDETIVRCEYCGKLRPADEAHETTIWRNHRTWREKFCKDDSCASYQQMAAEG